MSEQTINGVRRDTYLTNIVRKVEFWIGDDEICSVIQKFDIDNIDFWLAPTVHVNNNRFQTAEVFNLHIEALKQAAEVFTEWDRDTGKEIEQ